MLRYEGRGTERGGRVLANRDVDEDVDEDVMGDVIEEGIEEGLANAGDDTRDCKVKEVDWCGRRRRRRGRRRRMHRWWLRCCFWDIAGSGLLWGEGWGKGRRTSMWRR
jgi:hypothetical protein